MAVYLSDLSLDLNICLDFMLLFNNKRFRFNPQLTKYFNNDYDYYSTMSSIHNRKDVRDKIDRLKGYGLWYNGHLYLENSMCQGLLNFWSGLMQNATYNMMLLFTDAVSKSSINKAKLFKNGQNNISIQYLSTSDDVLIVFTGTRADFERFW